MTKQNGMIDSADVVKEFLKKKTKKKQQIVELDHVRFGIDLFGQLYWFDKELQEWVKMI